MLSSDQNETQKLYEFAEEYDNYPELASNIAMDAKEKGEPEPVVTFFESLGDTYVEDKDQVMSMLDQVDEPMTDSMGDLTT